MIPWKPRGDGAPGAHVEHNVIATSRLRQYFVTRWRNWRFELMRGSSWRHILKLAGIAILTVLALAFGWASWVAPPWGPMQPADKPTLIFLSANGLPIARRGRDAAVDAATLPVQVRGAFIAIEDRRFMTHSGVELRALLRAFIHNARAGGIVEGGSTITQQYAKGAFLTSDREIGRKLKEIVLAVWLDAWLSKNQILSRYLSTIYFGDGVWGLRGASSHYFGKAPDKLTVAEAAMLAGMVKAPSRLSPTRNLPAAQARSRLVLQAMAEVGMISGSAARTALAVPRRSAPELPMGTYFTDWAVTQIKQQSWPHNGQVNIHTTLDESLQRAAVRALTSILSQRGGALHATQAALVAMRPDGAVVALVGGRSYKSSPFNRATQASRQPGSAFKLAVYLAAFQRGYSPDDLVDNGPLSVEDWTPRNYGNHYGLPLSLRDAFAQSSNVAAVRLAEQIGREEIADIAKRLGINSPIASGPSMALGSSGTTLIELTAAYAAVAGGHFGITPYGLSRKTEPGQDLNRTDAIDPVAREKMLDVLWSATNQGTGRAASLSIPTFGKTGTTQNHRDAVFIGFAGGLVTGVWVGNDDNSPMRGVTGGALPALIWHAFMERADLNAADLPLPPTLQSAIDERIADMRAAELAREQELLQQEEEQPEVQDDDDGSQFLRFFRPFVPRFLRH